jgi:hypothetical protein
MALAQTAYFPKGILDNNPQVDRLDIDWYSGQLRALKEPSLLQLAKTPTAQSYRFLWLRTFHHPIAVRLDIASDGSGVLTTKEANGAGGYKPGSLIRNTSKRLTLQQTQAFLKKIESLGFWSMPQPDRARDGDDGSEWVIEGANKGKYHVVRQWSPKTGPIRDLGTTFAIELSGLQIPNKEFY